MSLIRERAMAAFRKRLNERAVAMKRFDQVLKDAVSGYDGKFSEIIQEAPAFFRLMTRLLDDRDLPKGLSHQIIAAIAYFVLPADVFPEDIYGPIGYIDDIYLCALVADRVMKQVGSDYILTRNWDGKMPVAPLIKEILNHEKELIGDNKDQIMAYFYGE
jgi:uncharacterized membrane protein YkvA (DUF1232 family)